MQPKVRPPRAKTVVRAGVIGTDLVSVLLAAAGAEWLHYAGARVAEPAWAALAATVVCVYVVYVGLGVSDLRRVRRPRIASLATVYWTLAFLAVAGGALLISAEPSRTVANLALWYPASALGLMAWRSLALRLADVPAVARFLADRVALVVTDEKADGAAWGKRIQAAAGRKAEIVATTLPGGLGGGWSGRVLNSAHELAWRCDELAVDQILVVAPGVPGEQLLKRLLPLSACAVEVDVLAYGYDAETTRWPAASFHGLPVVRLVQPPLGEVQRFVKRAEDIVLALIAIAAFAPVLVAIAAAVKLSSPGPVMFRQRRHGFNHANFEVLKFRTMYTAAERPGEVRQATRGDKRVTPVGRILRCTSLDELPQVFNVLLGEMSMVGPRPHAVEHNMLYGQLIDRYMQRHRMKPGITGWAQAKGLRGETEDLAKMQARVDCDIWYIENWSILLDLKICLMTLSVLWHRNAY
jgi:putative colanic acid biosynthesis UDP-glucose lipid carrier transferase